jgi:hypothetical protein
MKKIPKEISTNPKYYFSQSSQFEKTIQIAKQINHTQKSIISVVMFENTVPNTILVKS